MVCRFDGGGFWLWQWILVEFGWVSWVNSGVAGFRGSVMVWLCWWWQWVSMILAVGCGCDGLLIGSWYG